MSWNFMQLELTDGGDLIPVLVGPGGMTRTGASGEIRRLLDRESTLDADTAEAGQVWRSGEHSDFVYAMPSRPMIWCIYEHPDGEDPSFAAMTWIRRFVAWSDAGAQQWKAQAVGAGQPGDTPEHDEVGPFVPTVHRLEVGSLYQPAVTSWPEAGAMLRLGVTAVEFVWFLKELTPAEIRACASGTAQFALWPADRFLCWCYKFTDSAPARAESAGDIPWQYSPWEYGHNAAVEMTAVPGGRGESFAMRFVLVKADTGKVEALRVVRPPVAFADALRDAVDRQTSIEFDPDVSRSQIEMVYEQYSHNPAQLAARATAQFTIAPDGTVS